MYLAHTQFRMFGAGTEPMRSLAITIRTAADPAAVAGTLRREVAALDGNLSVDDVRTMADVRASSLSMQRFVWLLLANIRRRGAGVAIIGVYGVIAYSGVAATARDRRADGARRHRAQRDRAGAAAGYGTGHGRA